MYDVIEEGCAPTASPVLCVWYFPECGRVGVCVRVWESGLSETAHSPSKHKDKHGFIISQCKHTEL